MRNFIRSMSLFLLAASGSAQCGAWDPGLGVPGVQGLIFAMARWDADGPGPLPARLVLGGGMSSAGPLVTSGIVTFDPATSTFQGMGAGVVGTIYSTVSLPNGSLLVEGQITAAGGMPVNGAAVWDGVQWSAPPFAIDNAYAWNGQAVVCGSGTIDVWDGVTRVSLGALSGSVFCAAEAPNGDLVIGGTFTSVGGVAANGLARWDGTQWTALQTPTNGPMSYILAVGFRPNGDLVIGGSFNVTTPNGQFRYLARWNGTSWLPFGTGPSYFVRCINSDANGDLLIGGEFTSVNGTQAPGFARWNGSAWSSVGGSVTGVVHAMLPWPAGGVYVGGTISAVGGQPARAFAHWTGSQWSVLPGIDEDVKTVLPLRDGRILVGGAFNKFGPAVARRVAMWNGTTWQALGSGLSGGPAGGWVLALAELPNGDIVAGGTFTTAGGSAIPNIARWNGSTWSAMGGGLNGYVRCLEVLPNGDLVAGGDFTSLGTTPATAVARWNGTAWSPMPGLFGSDIRRVLAMPNGDVVVTGGIGVLPSTAQVPLARWNGTTWSVIPTGGDGLFLDLAVLPNGNLIAAGTRRQFSPTVYAGLAEWNGVAWSSPLATPSQDAYSVAVHPDGRLVYVGPVGPALAVAVRVVDGGAATDLGYVTGAATCVRTTVDGDIITTGSFQYINQFASPYYARYSSTCRPTATVSGPGCPHAGGVPTLSARELPWLDATYRIDGASLPATSIAVAVTGFGAASTPIAGVLQPSHPSCTLWVTPDLLATALATGGTVTFATAVPSSPAIVGLSLHQQLLVLGLDSQLQPTDFSLSNALQLTIGTL